MTAARRLPLALALVPALLAGCSGATAPPPQGVAGASATPSAVEACPATTAGSRAGGLPTLTLPCLGEGPAVHLAGLRGTPALVNIWASWCGPCTEEVPLLEAVHRAAGSKLRILGVDIEDVKARALAFASGSGMTYPSAFDADGTALRRVGAVGPPVTLFVDASGRVVHKELGPFRSEADVRAMVARYLGVAL